MSTSTIHTFLATAARLSSQPALVYRRGGEWVRTSWADYATQVRRAARALIALGMERGDALAIVGPNRPEWLVSDLAAMAIGCVPAPIYPTLTPEQSAYVAGHSGATVAVVHDQRQLDKLASQRASLPRLRCCVLMDGEPLLPALPADGPLGEVQLLSFKALLALGEAQPEAELEKRLASLGQGQLATLIYTSGTTGPPKAVMLTHGNLLHAARVACEAMNPSGHDVSVSYLPLSHIAEQMLSIHLPAVGGGTLWCCEKLEDLPELLRLARPTLFFGVPRVWEKLQARIEEGLAQASLVQRLLFAGARAQGLAADEARLRGERPGLLSVLTRSLVLSKLHQKLGLDRVRVCGTGAAPISGKATDFWRSVGLPLHSVWGLSEVSGAGTFHRPGQPRPVGVGRVATGMELRIAEDGEILLRGPAVFTGYLKDEAATRAAFDEQGWFHTGDVGRLDERGELHITDRKKDLLITSGGKNVSPQNIEGLLRRIPGIAQAVVVGDGHKYLAALLTLETDSAARVARECGARGTTPADWVQDTKVLGRVQAAVDEVNRQLAQYERVKKFRLLPVDFSIEGGELTPTLKVKRKVVNTKYADEIAQLFAEP